MIKCPNCGEQLENPPEEAPLDCPECGMPLPDPSITDPFEAAAAQEQAAREQQRKLHETYQRRNRTKHPESEPLPSKPDPVIKAAYTGAHPEIAQEPAPAPKKKSGKKRTDRWMIVLSIVVIVGLCIYAGYTLTHDPNGNLTQEVAPENTYAVYVKENALWVYLEDTRQTIRLTGLDGMTMDYPLEELVQLSPDGKRLYYPTEFSTERNQQLFTLCCRTLSDVNTEQKTVRVSLAQSMEWRAKIADIPDADNLFNLCPPYALIDNAVFYIDSTGQLCRRTDYTDSPIIVPLHWFPYGSCIYYIEPSVFYFDADGSASVKNALSLTVTPHGCYETAPYPCYLNSCNANGTFNSLQGLPIEMNGWCLPEKDCAQYFYSFYRMQAAEFDLFADSFSPVLTDDPDVDFAQIPDSTEYKLVIPEPGTNFPQDLQIEPYWELYQTDLLHPERSEKLTECKPNTIPPRVLQAYPDGSCYYVAETEGAVTPFIYYFRRNHDKSYIVMAYDQLRQDRDFDILRDEPYYLYKGNPFSSDSSMLPELWYGEQGITMQFSENSAVNTARNTGAFFPEGGKSLLIRCQPKDSSGHETLYRGLLNTASSSVFIYAVQPNIDGERYFTPPHMTDLLVLKGTELHLAGDRDILVYSNVIRCGIEQGWLHFLSSDGVFYRYRTGGSTIALAQNVEDYRFIESALYLYYTKNTDGKLVLHNGEHGKTADSDITELVKVGRLPADGTLTEETGTKTVKTVPVLG